MFFFKSKTISHKQAAMIGLVLALISLLTMGVMCYVFPHFGAWLNNNGVYQLDLFLLVFFVTIFLAVQGLLLFGFPLYYAQDKKSHMTGFQILVYALMWMVGLVLAVSLVMIPLNKQKAYTMEDLTPTTNVDVEVPAQE